MESEWTELRLDSQFETDRTGVANQPDILVLKEGSGFDVATVKKHDKLIKHFDVMHMSTRTPRRSQLDGWLRDSKQSWTLHGTKLPYKVPYNEGWSGGTRLNSEQYRKCKNFTKHNTVAELQQEISTYRARQHWTYWLKLKLDFKKLSVSVLPDASIDLYLTKKKKKKHPCLWQRDIFGKRSNTSLLSGHYACLLCARPHTTVTTSAAFVQVFHVL